ncbi:MAG: 4'-phosphopantetheinyl transferase superfamily protein [Deltaproteobacteria bacterium]|nr:4'-phosphopantetheinyl transferase superfamily protein [Deltaproteobacteria bacterium]
MPEEVDIWLASLDPSPELSLSIRTLSVDEAERKFHFASDRVQFITARAILRDILSRYLGCAAEQLQFAYHYRGKPRLRGATSITTDLRFNLSHCPDAALYAVSRGREVGVDIELVRPEMPWEQLANSFFAPGETAKLQQWPPHRRTFAFFTCWTRKEAYVKALGDGLLLPLHAFEVSAAPGEKAALLAAADPAELKRWSFFDIPLGDSFAGSLVVEGYPSRVRLLNWHWTELCS